MRGKERREAGVRTLESKTTAETEWDSSEPQDRLSCFSFPLCLGVDEGRKIDSYFKLNRQHEDLVCRSLGPTIITGAQSGKGDS